MTCPREQQDNECYVSLCLSSVPPLVPPPPPPSARCWGGCRQTSTSGIPPSVISTGCFATAASGRLVQRITETVKTATLYRIHQVTRVTWLSGFAQLHHLPLPERSLKVWVCQVIIGLQLRLTLGTCRSKGHAATSRVRTNRRYPQVGIVGQQQAHLQRCPLGAAWHISSAQLSCHRQKGLTVTRWALAPAPWQLLTTSC